MPAIDDLVIHALQQVWLTLTHNWPFLLANARARAYLRALSPGCRLHCNR